MLTDKLGRQFVKGQKVVFRFDGMLEAEVVEVQEVSMISGAAESGKLLVLAGIHRVHVTPKAVTLPEFYIVFDPAKEGTGLIEQ